MTTTLNRQVKFNVPTSVGTEGSYIAEVLENGKTSGDGLFTKKCSQLLEETLKVPKVLLTTSCTHALEMSAILLDIQPGDEVIIPSFTFVSTVNAFVLRGARPVFIDVQPDTLNLDPDLLESKISAHTRAIVPVHYAGVGCEMDVILNIAAAHGVQVVEDNAHGLFGKYKGKYLGTFGAMATQSFHETKNFSCGEGGALVINDQGLLERAEIIREKGTNRGRFFRGQVDKYTWVDIGSSYLPSEILAAALYAQLEVWEDIQARRRKIWEFYDRELKGWAQDHAVQLPHVPEYCEQSYHEFFMLMPSFEHRQGLIGHLRDRNIQSVFHYLPLHVSDMGRKYGGREGQCPVTERVSDQLIRLPFYTGMTEEDQQRVVEAILLFNY